MLSSITQFSVQINHILVHNLFSYFPGPGSLSGSLILQSNTFFSASHHRPLLKHVHTVTIYFFVPLLLSSPAPAACSISATTAD